MADGSNPAFEAQLREAIRKAQDARDQAENAGPQMRGQCIECRWIKRSEWSEGDRCTNPVALVGNISFVTGTEREAAPPKVEHARASSGFCMPVGAFWQHQSWRFWMPRYRRGEFAKMGTWLGLILPSSLIAFGTLLSFLIHLTAR